ncbi:MAG: hypothetical protein DMG10_00045 [Acidobacteria bacterium]|nr:MAG: hypothetical protein DMG10_00045 [Acidobacteriota bacterium]
MVSLSSFSARWSEPKKNAHRRTHSFRLWTSLSEYDSGVVKQKKSSNPKRGLKTSSSLFAQYLFVPASAFITLVARRCQEKNRTLVVEASTVRRNLGKELTPEKDSHRFTILFAHSRFYANEIAR